MTKDMRDIMNAVDPLVMLGDGFAHRNDGLGDTPDGGFEPNPDADPADVEKAWAEVAKRLKPADWAAIAEAAGVSPDILIPRRSSSGTNTGPASAPDA